VGKEDPGQADGLAPVNAVTPTEQSGEVVRHRAEQTYLQHERHLPSRPKTSGSGKPRYGLPDAPLDSCPLVSASDTLYEDRDPLSLFSFRSKDVVLSFGQLL
jgi:hypothetical protein